MRAPSRLLQTVGGGSGPERLVGFGHQLVVFGDERLEFAGNVGRGSSARTRRLHLNVGDLRSALGVGGLGPLDGLHERLEAVALGLGDRDVGRDVAEVLHRLGQLRDAQQMIVDVQDGASNDLDGILGCARQPTAIGPERTDVDRRRDERTDDDKADDAAGDTANAG